MGEPLGVNPKDAIGFKKVNLYLLPPVAAAHACHAMMDGARKYGPYNWRDKKVIASVYIAAAKRHIDAWGEKEECADDSGVHHLGHAIACLAILLDAQATNNLTDDRAPGGRLTEVLKSIQKKIEEKWHGMATTPGTKAGNPPSA